MHNAPAEVLHLPRSRPLYAGLLVATLGLGLASRAWRTSLPDFLGAYAGDTLWALMIFLGVALLFPTRPTRQIALAAASFSLGIELSQLYHAPWIDAIRHTRPGGLVLGFGFLWSDLACYAAGIALGALFDRMLNRTSTSPHRD